MIKYYTKGMEKKTLMNKVVCVVNNYDIFNKVVKNNENLINCEILDIDNTAENTSITKRYNEIIEKNANLNSWMLFIHQDFGITENINPILENLDKNFVYGVIGPKTIKEVKTEKLGKSFTYSILCGQIMQGKNNFDFKEFGYPVKAPETVDAIDCCCIIMHSTLINQYNLRFDEKLKFHMYAEELCYRAKHDYGIETKVIPMKCFHMGTGKLDEKFQESVKYLKEKFKTNNIPSTCPT